ncbi:MAG TPA: hotdog domain-containing protein, partial [Nitrospiraceae bacterium]|nr:hotdog domain-containing protein [Nitrospiraceae bacterium]
MSSEKEETGNLLAGRACPAASRVENMDIRIYYEDTDCGGMVYYGNYLKYFERARTQYLEERGLSVAELMKEGTMFVVVHAEVDYRSPAR